MIECIMYKLELKMERQQTIEKLKRDKTLKNYVLWLIKAKERLPNIPPFLLPKVDLYALSGEVFSVKNGNTTAR